MSLLDVKGLYVDIHNRNGVIRAVDDINLNIEKGRSLCLAGESGCGKTMVALSIMQLLPENFTTGGEINFKGDSLIHANNKKLRRIRGNEMSMIFEQPATCLNPVLTVGDQIADVIITHQQCSRRIARERAVDLLNIVGINSASRRCHQYPHEFSGGMQQRVMIALAIANNPSLLIADEPTTSLDTPIQIQIIDLLQELTGKLNGALMLITHDLDLARRLCSRMAVMYAGEIVEIGDTESLFSHPCHPYTQALITATSELGTYFINGQVPELDNRPEGCSFHPRCPHTMEICRHIKPALTGGSRCHLQITN